MKRARYLLERSALSLMFAAAAGAGPLTTGEAVAGGRSELVHSALQRGVEHRRGELLVQFRRGAEASTRARALGRIGARGVGKVIGESERDDGGGDLELVRVPPGIDVATAVGALELEEGVEFAEPNWVYRRTLTSNDPYYASGALWGMYGGYGTNAYAAWAANTPCAVSHSPLVYVGIVDEGFMTTHPDLASNTWRNPYDAIDGFDNDGNGFADDANGWDFVNNDRSVFDGAGDDHGTHVAGIVGASGGNGTGVVGMCWKLRMISAKFLGRDGGTAANAVRAVDYITYLKKRHGLNIVATNNSWGGGGYSQALADAITRASNANILFVAAAGNGGSDGIGDDIDYNPFYPASYTHWNIIAVASISADGSLSPFSNYGARSVDIGAPGSDIYSTLPSADGGSTYGSYSGTSMAAPHVTGAIAMYAARHPGSSAWTIKQAILSAGVPLASLTGRTKTGRRLNVGWF